MSAYIDLTRIGAQNVSAEQWYAGLLVETGRALGLRAEFLKQWKEQIDLPPVQHYFTALREVRSVVQNTADPLIVYLIGPARSEQTRATQPHQQIA